MNTHRPAPICATLLGALLLAGVAPDAGHAVPAKPAAGSALTVPFIADDYTRAVAEAKARKVPLFIEAWAPW